MITAAHLPGREPLLTRRGWAAWFACLALLCALAPLLNLWVGAGSVFHLSDFAVALVGKIMCYALCAIAMDLIWGYTGILSLGHGLFFALGSGIAGLAGCALSQIGNVGPDLGQSYIVDAFMVVVLGGVGQLAGTVLAALGLGVINKFLEGLTGAVLAKIAVLLFIIVFIQKRPQGIFALKGRSADA